MTFRKLRLFGSLFTPIVGAAFSMGVEPASAAVTEPNGLQVPNLAADVGKETDLKTFFSGLGETFDVMADANWQPAVFSPMCDFSAQMIFSQSQGKAGVAWYNVPADPKAIPDKIYQLLPPDNVVPAAGGLIASTDIRNSVDYKGGLIGFVLTDNGGRIGPDGTSRIYYSEPSRNDFCSGCTTPGNWIMTLTYKSTLPQYQNTYYLAFEDWLTTSSTTLGESDCDFNDKVFRVSGIQCQGGGVPCDTGLLGVCKPGLTECTIGTTTVCRSQVPKSDERCDNVDNNCDGVIDNGDGLCSDPAKVCDHGTCVAACSPTEFPCPSGLACSGKFCVEPACAAVKCDPGLVCRGGNCIDACSGFTCPIGQLCETGVCVDPCKGVECATGTVCSNGACIASCECAGCPPGKVCQTNGSCVDKGCETQTCALGQVCLKGVCTDACTGATCPGNAACTQGQCGTPSQSGSGGSTSAGSGVVLGSGNSVSYGTGSDGSGNSASQGATAAPSSSSGGCGCQLPATRSFGFGSLAMAALLLLRRRRSES